LPAIIAGRERKVKVIFLDFDGVLNSRSRWKECQKVDPRSPSALIDPLAAWRVKQLIAQTGAKVVVSSSWRHIHPLEQLKGFLWKYGISRDLIIGKTPRIGRRGHEIRAWLKKYNENHENNPVTNYLILDDDPDAGGGGVDRNRLVKTEWETGLLADHLLKGIAVLGRRTEVH
jgi:hypothetical protein